MPKQQSVDLVIGSQVDPGATQQLIAEISRLSLTDATLYVGYPILSTADESLSLDALLTSTEHAVVVFDFRQEPPNADEEWEELEDHQVELEIALKAKLIKHKDLTKRRDLSVPIHVVTFLPHVSKYTKQRGEILLADQASLASLLSGLPGIVPELSRPLNAAIQQVTTIKPRKKRLNVKSDDTRGGKLKVIEKEIANLDRWQKKAAIECPDGPQRIRGLAGSGKTVVLALKAAYLHAQHPEWTIAITFQTRSLYGQIRDLIRRFTFEHIQDEPDWEHLRVLHAWGSGSSPGLYSTIAQANNLTIRTFNYGKSRYLSAGAFEGVCKELLNELPRPPAHPFDAVLVDEAQDFGPNFFRMVRRSLKDPKRLIWAYDDLQSLKETGIPSLADLFGTDSQGKPVVQLANEEGKPQQDIILPVCYRNTPWALSVAHATGFGIYRQDGMIQCFDNAEFWSEIGYGVESGTLSDGEDVTLKRRDNSTPSFFARLLTSADAVQFRAFDSDEAEATWIADQIATNLTDDELDPSDIVVIFSNPLTVDRASGPLRALLRKKGIEAHLAGVTRSADEFFIPDSVTLSGIYRAKGNEAAMVYVTGSQYCFGSWGSLIRNRNILFTAITRSRAWVRITGVGPVYQKLAAEIQEVLHRDFRLSFRVPTEEERKKMRQIHRDRTAGELKKIAKSRRSLEEVVALLENQELTLEDIPKDLRAKVASLLGMEATEE